MSWRTDELIIWKRGAEVVINNFDGYKLIKFFKSHPTLLGYKDSDNKWFYKIYTDVTAEEYNFCGGTPEEITHLKTLDPMLYSSVSISKQTLNSLVELNKLGWYEMVDTPT